MKDYLLLIEQFGPEFASGMIQKLLSEANSVVGTKGVYKHSDHFRESLISRASAWKEAIITYEYIQEFDRNKNATGS